MALDATVAGPAANSYLTLAAADAYAANDPISGAEWLAASDAAQEQALIAATADVDLYQRAAGTRYSAAQALLFPRDVDVASSVAFLLSDVKRATYEQAVYLLVNHELIADAASRRARALFNFSDYDGSGQPAMNPSFGLYAPKMTEYLARIGSGQRTRRTIVSVPYASSFELPS